MTAVLGVGNSLDFDAGILDALTPEAILRLDMIAGEILELGSKDDAVRALRAALIRSVR